MPADKLSPLRITVVARGRFLLLLPRAMMTSMLTDLCPSLGPSVNNVPMVLIYRLEALRVVLPCGRNVELTPLRTNLLLPLNPVFRVQPLMLVIGMQSVTSPTLTTMVL